MNASLKNSCRLMVITMVCGLGVICGGQNAQATIILTAGSGGSNLTSVGLDIQTTSVPSIAPVFPSEYSLVAGSELSVAGTGDLGANYVVANLNDDTGYSYLIDNATNRGWIPDSTDVETATLTFNTPSSSVGLGGIDFLTLFTNRTAGSYSFEYSTNNQSTWTEIFSLTNDSSSDLFRQGVTFDAIFGVTDVRLITDATGGELFIGEVDLFTVPAPVPEPTTMFPLALGIAVLIRSRRRRASA